LGLTVVTAKMRVHRARLFIRNRLAESVSVNGKASSVTRPSASTDDEGETMTVCAPLTDEQFERARWLALRLTGIELLDRHRGLLQRRRARLAVPESFDAWLGAAEEGDGNACRRLTELFTTTYIGNPAGEIYGKVVDATPATPGLARVRFTSATPELRAWMTPCSSA